MRGVTARLFAFLALLLVCGSASADPVSGLISVIGTALAGTGALASWAMLAVSVVSSLSKASQARKQARQAAARKAAAGFSRSTIRSIIRRAHIAPASMLRL